MSHFLSLYILENSLLQDNLLTDTFSYSGNCLFTLGHFLCCLEAFYYFLIYSIPTAVSPPSTPSLPPSLSPRSTSLFSFRKKADLPEISTKHSLIIYIKTCHTSSCQGWTRQQTRRKRAPRVGERVRNTSHSHF